jgi:glycosyltransferase involved in cell wall biosynthesis
MKNQQPFLQVYLMCYNRPDYVIEALESLLSQDYPHFKVIISDNSTTDEVANKLSNYKSHPLVNYLRRSPSLDVLAHHNQIVSEVTAPYFMMFHDDDIMLPGALSKLVSGIVGQNFSAIGSNAFILEDNLITTRKFNPYLTQDLQIQTQKELARHHLVTEAGHVPFPSYLYKTELAQKLRFNFKEGHRYADATYLLKLCELGPLCWLQDCLIYYRKHSSSASLKIDIKATISLCRFVSSKAQLSYCLVREYKMKHYFIWSLQRKKGLVKSLSPHKDFVIRKAAFRYVTTHPNILARALLKKIIRRFGSDA